MTPTLQALQQAILNLAGKDRDTVRHLYGDSVMTAYYAGHRDAREASAELVAALSLPAAAPEGVKPERAQLVQDIKDAINEGSAGDAPYHNAIDTALSNRTTRPTERKGNMDPADCPRLAGDAPAAVQRLACQHEPFEGRCVHCNVSFIDGRPAYVGDDDDVVIENRDGTTEMTPTSAAAVLPEQPDSKSVYPTSASGGDASKTALPDDETAAMADSKLHPMDTPCANCGEKWGRHTWLLCPERKGRFALAACEASAEARPTDKTASASVSVSASPQPSAAQGVQDGPCPKCGQQDTGQYGEYPCSECGLPTLHDDPAPEAAGAAPVAFADRRELAELAESNGMSVWCDGPRMYLPSPSAGGVACPPNLIPLYATPPEAARAAPVAISDEQIIAAWQNSTPTDAPLPPHCFEFARALLSAHPVPEEGAQPTRLRKIKDHLEAGIAASIWPPNAEIMAALYETRAALSDGTPAEPTATSAISGVPELPKASDGGGGNAR